MQDAVANTSHHKWPVLGAASGILERGFPMPSLLNQTWRPHEEHFPSQDGRWKSQLQAHTIAVLPDTSHPA